MTKKNFKITETTNTMESILNINQGDHGTIQTIDEVDEQTRQAVYEKLEKKDKKILLLVKPSVHAELKEIAWNNHKSLNGLLNDIIENYLDNEHIKEIMEND